MNAAFMNSKTEKTDKSKASNRNNLLINLSDNTNLKKTDSFILFYQLLASAIHGKFVKLSKNGNFEKLAEAWNDRFESFDGIGYSKKF